MRIIEHLEEGMPIFDALNNGIRVKILQLLLKNHQMNMNDIAVALNLPKSTLTPHIKKLVQAELIDISLHSETRGTQKICKLIEDKLIVNIIPQPTDQKVCLFLYWGGSVSRCVGTAYRRT